MAGAAILSERARVLCLAGYAIATFAAFPHPLAGRVVDLGWLFAWVAPGLLVLGLEGRSTAQAAREGWLAGLSAHGLVLHWIFVVTVTYGHAPAVVGVLAPLILAGYMAAFTAAFAVGWAALARAGLAGPFAAAILWTATDHARSFVLTGFPWATIGYAQHQNPALLGIVQWTGVYGLSFVSVLGSTALALAWRRRRAGQPVGRSPIAALSTAAAVGVVGWLAPDPSPGPDAPTLRIAALQGNIGQGDKWSREWADRTLGYYEELARRAAEQGARLAVWPETAAPGALAIDSSMRDRVVRLAQETRTAQVVGSVGVERDFDGGTPRFYDSAFVLTPGGEFTHRYDKSHLVPFGEYVPFRGLIGRLASAVARGIANNDVSAGPGPYAVEISVSSLWGENAGEAPALSSADSGGESAGEAPALDPAASGGGSAGEAPAVDPTASGDLRLGGSPPDPPDPAEPTAGASPAFSRIKMAIPICYELLFPDLVRRFVKDGGRVLLAITNDAWYGKSGAPHQFLAITTLRSAETGAWTVRAANTGVTAVIDGRGRVRARTEVFERDLIVMDVPLLPEPGTTDWRPTFYVRHGDVFAWSCWALAALALGWTRWGGRAATADSDGGARHLG